MRTQRAVICYIFNNGRVLLQKKSRGLFGEGKWNGPGGKIKLNETPSDAVIREVYEETRIRISRPRKVGRLNFYLENNRAPAITAHVFTIGKFDGKPTKSDEGILKWFDKDKLPYERMWADDIYWLPLLVKGKKFEGKFIFGKDFAGLLSHEVKELK